MLYCFHKVATPLPSPRHSLCDRISRFCRDCGFRPCRGTQTPTRSEKEATLRPKFGHCAVFPTASMSSCLLQCWRHYDRKPLPFNHFDDPHPLTPVVSISYENSGGRGCSTLRLRFRLKFFKRNTYVPPPVKVARNGLTVLLTPLNAPLTRITGKGCQLWLTATY